MGTHILNKAHLDLSHKSLSKICGILLLLLYGMAFWYGSDAHISEEANYTDVLYMPDRACGFTPPNHAPGTNDFGFSQQNNRQQFRLVTTPDQKNNKSGTQYFFYRTAEDFDYNSFAYLLLREVMGRVKGMFFEDYVAHELRVFYERMLPKSPAPQKAKYTPSHICALSSHLFAFPQPFNLL